jgi:hypothetical protein
MPIPPLDVRGFLPEGTYDCSLAEIREVFGTGSRRQILCGNLETYCNAWRRTGLLVQIYVDGGFVTIKPEDPKDVDVVVDISRLDLRDLTVVSQAQPLLNQATLRMTHQIDVYAFHPVIGPNDLRRFFTYIRPEQRTALGLPDGFRKGLLRIQL